MLKYIDLCVAKVASLTNNYSKYYEMCEKIHLQLMDFEINCYDNTINPLQLVWVDPNRIERCTHRSYPPWKNDEGGSRFKLIGEVKDGNWDKPNKDSIYPKYFTDDEGYEPLKSYLTGEKDYSEAFSYLIDKVKCGGEVWHGCTTEADIQQRCELLKTIYEDIQADGYKPQRQLVSEGKELRTFRGAVLNEIAVDVSREGDLLFVDGSHRLIMAKILDLEQIPVIVYVRHKRYVEDRGNRRVIGDCI